MGKCIVCHERPAEVPDRKRMGAPIKRVCRECHAERIRGDLLRLVEAEVKRNRPKEADHA